MTEPIEDQIQRPKVSEVDRAYPDGVPGPDRWSFVLLIAFALAMYAASFVEHPQAVPDAFLAAVSNWYGGARYN